MNDEENKDLNTEDKEDNEMAKSKVKKKKIKINFKELLGNLLILFAAYIFLSFYGYLGKWVWLYETVPLLSITPIMYLFTIFLIVVGIELPRDFKELRGG